MKKKVFWMLLCVTLASAHDYMLADDASRVVYVSPSGNDAAEGSVDAPLRTLRAAVEKSRTMQGEKEIKLAEGTYMDFRPLVFTAADSNLTVSGAGMGKTLVTGGIQLPRFEEARRGLWRMDVQQILTSGGEIEQLYVNDKRAVRARTPNENRHFITGQCKQVVADSVSWRGNLHAGYAIHAISIPDEAASAMAQVTDKTFTQMVVSVLHAWDITRWHLGSYSPDKKTLYTVGNLEKPWNVLSRTDCSQFFLENDFSFLDDAGEFFCDAEQAMLYYIPRPGETIDNSTAMIPVTKQLMVFEGTAQEKVRNVRVQGLSLSYTRFTMPWWGNEPQQAAASTDAVVMMDFAEGVKFDGCEISHTGNNGIWIRKACTDCALTNSYLHDLGIGAVKIGDMEIPDDETLLTKHIVVDNNILRAGSRVFPTGVGVTLFQASDCSITHNEVADFYYSGMSVGWHWGYEYSPSKRNKVLYNHIHHIGWGVLSDMGGVYTLGPSEGTEVSHNVIHDIYSFGYGGWGLYTDEGSTGIKMQYNLVYNCKSSGFHQHYGKENIISNNIFVNNLKAQLEATRVEDHLSFTFSNNVLYFTQGDLYGKQWPTVRFEADKNLYWCPDGTFSFNGQTLKEWTKATGKDKHSVVADPGFTDIGKADFHMNNKGVLRRISFKPFAYSEAGVYGDAAWKQLARFDADRARLYDEVVGDYENR